MYWKPVFDHDDCYFCKTEIPSNVTKAKKRSIRYANVTTAEIPKPFGKEEDRPMPINRFYADETSDVEMTSCDEEFFEDMDQPILFTQASLNDLIRNLNLPKNKSEQLARILKKRKLVKSDCKSTYFRNRHQ